LIDPKIERIFEAVRLGQGDYPPSFETTRYPRGPKKKSIQEVMRRPGRDGKTPVLTEQVYSKHRPEIVRKFRSMHDHDGEILPEYQTKKFAQRLLPQRWESGPTITATSLPDDYVHFSQPRSLTVREWARLQLFPDWYQFAGKRTTGGLRRAGNPREGIFDRELPKYTQIGNAVPVGLAHRIGLHFTKLLEAAGV
jgi:DNA (cytosine-5)-methyltransferase 1